MTRSHLCLAVLLCASAGTSSAQGYQFTTLDPDRPYVTIIPNAINNSGSVTGVWVDPAQADHGFIANAGAFTSFDAPQADTVKVGGVRGTWASGLDSAGTVVGVYTAGGAQHGFVRLADGTTATLDITGHSRTALTAINDNGQMLGVHADDNTLLGGTSFLRSAGGALTLISMPGSIFSEAEGLNNDGVIVGGYDDAASVLHGYVRAPNGVFTSIEVAGTDTTVLSGINDTGWIVGEYDVGGVGHGFLRDPLGAVTTIDVPGASFTSAIGINAAGAIVGQFCDAANVCHGFVAAPVPEPPGGALMAAGVGVVGLLLRRRTARWRAQEACIGRA